jgi:hypothetical protein
MRRLRHSIERRRAAGLSLVLAAALLLAGASAASAYSWRTCGGGKQTWSGSRANMYISTTSFPPGSSWDGRLQNAMWHWNNVKGSGFNFWVGRDTDGTHRLGNGRNEIYLENNSGSALAVTYTRTRCYWFFGWHRGIKETDIGYNVNYSWSTGSYSYANPTGSPFNFESVSLHELGHSLGLLHENRRMATMNSFYPNSGPLGYYKQWDPYADDRQGARFLYPDSTTEVDVAGSPLRRTGSGTSNRVTSPGAAARGSWVTIQFTFSNLSTSTRSFNIGFYLSTNSYISTFDTLLGRNWGAWGTAGFTGTFSRTLWIPSWVAPGTYYLGFLLDDPAALAEANEVNNNQPMPRSIVIF